MQEYNLDISFNTDIGDFEIINDEIPVINSKRKYILSYAREVLKTNQNDIFALPTFGTSFFDFIGKGLDESLVKETKIGQPAAKLSCTSVDRKNVQRSRFSQPVEPRGAVITAIF
jgi:hypothetical protein